MRPPAKVNEGTASIDGTTAAVGDALLNEVKLVRAVLKHLDEICFGHHETLEWLFCLYDGLGELLQGRLLGILNATGLGVSQGTQSQCSNMGNWDKSTYRSMLAMS
jgi:hypothetical protein